MASERGTPSGSRYAAVIHLHGAFTREEIISLLLYYRAKASWSTIRHEVRKTGPGMGYYLQAWLSVAEGDLDPADIPPWPGRHMALRYASSTRPREAPPQYRPPSPAALLGHATDSTSESAPLVDLQAGLVLPPTMLTTSGTSSGNTAQSRRAQSPAPKSPQEDLVGPVDTGVDCNMILGIADETLRGVAQIVNFAREVLVVSDERSKAIQEAEDRESTALDAEVDVLLKEIRQLGGLRIQ